ncbi:MAG: TldD/PmbA family protein [Candidatus Borkfalkiaceae bacterium]|nr:TldD/PmbA family protein [Christensenellaceae bacterium]
MGKIVFRKDLYADIRTERRFTTRVSIINGEIKQVTELDTDQAFIRVFDGEMWYYSSVSETDNLQKELDALYAFATPNENVFSHPVVETFEVNKDKILSFGEKSVDKVPIKEKIDFLTSALPLFQTPHTTVLSANYFDRYSLFKFVSAKGADIEYDYQTAGYQYALQLSAGEKTFANSYSACKTAFEDLSIDEKEIKEFTEETENFLLNAKPLEKAGNYPVILSPLATGIFAHESFGHKSEADFMLGDETMKKEWKLGTKVASDILSIADSGKYAGSGYVPYDDEGTKCTETYLIKNGVLSGRLHSVTTAVALGEKPTGNARAVNCDYEPIVRMTTTYVKEGTESFDDLVKGIKYGYYIKGVSHGSGLSTFTIAPTVCYEIKDGKITVPVKIAVITGDVFKTLSLVDGLSKEHELLSFVIGGCGKMEQMPLPVGFGGPYMRIKEMGVQ